jgi:uncharacterized protein (TIGR02266 family)
MGNALPKPAGTSVISLRVTVRADDLESFINKYAKHLHGDRIFIFTKNPQPVGTRVKFTLQLQSGEQLLHGKGTVVRVQAETSDKRHPPGMELVFVPLDDRSQTLVDFMLATRAEEQPAIVRAVSPPPPPKPPLSAVAPPPLPKEKEKEKEKDKPANDNANAKLDAKLDDLTKDKDEATSVDAVPLPPVAATPPQDPDPIEPAALERPSTIALKLAENVKPEASAPVSPGEAPAFAEKWRDPLPPGVPAAGTDNTVAANPFTEIPDSAIDYFVEWSLEQSIGPRSEPSAQFAEIGMSLPGVPVGGASDDPFLVPKAAGNRKLFMVGGGGFAAGTLLGVGLMFALRPSAPMVTRAAVMPAPEVAAAAAPPEAEKAAEPAPAAEKPAAPAPVEKAAAAPDPANPSGEPELSVVTHPPGATLTIDGKPAGTTPTVAKLSAGKHEVSLAKERYTTVQTSVEAPGQLSIELKRPATTLRVVSSPLGAEVSVAGVAHGRTPTSFKLPAYESYDVQVSLAGARPWRRSVYLKGTGNEVVAQLVSVKPQKPAAKR